MDMVSANVMIHHCLFKRGSIFSSDWQHFPIIKDQFRAIYFIDVFHINQDCSMYLDECIRHHFRNLMKGYRYFFLLLFRMQDYIMF